VTYEEKGRNFAYAILSHLPETIARGALSLYRYNEKELDPIDLYVSFSIDRESRTFKEYSDSFIATAALRAGAYVNDPQDAVVDYKRTLPELSRVEVEEALEAAILSGR
jgi:hypothetical protein